MGTVRALASALRLPPLSAAILGPGWVRLLVVGRAVQSERSSRWRTGRRRPLALVTGGGAGLEEALAETDEPLDRQLPA